MNSDYKTLKDFWNNSLKIERTDKVEGKWCTEDSFNNLMKKYIKEGDNVLDFGCGSGWASFEIHYTIPNLTILGIDQGKDAIDYCNRCAKASELTNITFVASEGDYLDNIEDKFDVVVSFNVFDVIPDEVIDTILPRLQKSVKNGGYLLVGINPELPDDILAKIGFVKKDGRMYKDGIMRANDKTLDQWKDYFSKYFEVVETTTFCVIEREHSYPRRMIVLKNVK